MTLGLTTARAEFREHAALARSVGSANRASPLSLPELVPAAPEASRTGAGHQVPQADATAPPTDASEQPPR
eukprot:11324990-Alexandrium_andersonii.AAC.1